MMLIYGGRDGSDNALNDTWGLRKHRDGKWDWAQAPSYKSDFYPKYRFNVLIPLNIILALCNFYRDSYGNNRRKKQKHSRYPSN